MVRTTVLKTPTDKKYYLNQWIAGAAGGVKGMVIALNLHLPISAPNPKPYTI